MSSLKVISYYLHVHKHHLKNHMAHLSQKQACVQPAVVFPAMPQTQPSEIPFHARPAGLLSKEARNHKSAITVVKGEKEANVLMNADEATEWLNKTMEAKEAEKNKGLAAEGEAFLAENAKREGVSVTESGLQYEVVTMGEGEKPTAESKVKVHYHGTLIDGTVFDSSVQRGEPIEFPLNGVIKGWTEGLQLMPVGSKFILYIPYQLAYGEQGAGELIGPYEALIFEVELLEIVE